MGGHPLPSGCIDDGGVGAILHLLVSTLAREISRRRSTLVDGGLVPWNQKGEGAFPSTPLLGGSCYGSADGDGGHACVFGSRLEVWSCVVEGGSPTGGGDASKSGFLLHDVAVVGDPVPEEDDGATCLDDWASASGFGFSIGGQGLVPSEGYDGFDLIRLCTSPYKDDGGYGVLTSGSLVGYSGGGGLETTSKVLGGFGLLLGFLIIGLVGLVWAGLTWAHEMFRFIVFILALGYYHFSRNDDGLIIFFI
ncbi:hypothetical protein RchiOBHm_Chr7g0184531 [Rosa chinensis]|uniref:Uncharacterized protein n=1 Tax=Rosa chinensis TaxID=74649 RepID=A0A2P6P3H7_ROSCH|nr:hypothetical protein RchiOBHm_Chr7g0184531 [Rosa chinensis]